MADSRPIYDDAVSITKLLCEMEFGEHNMLVYQDLNSFRYIYVLHSKKTLISSDRSMLILTHYETETAIRNTLKEYEISAEQHLADRSLIIGDASIILSKSNTINDLVHYIKSIESISEKRGRTKLDIIIDMGCFYHLNKNYQLTEFERSIDNKSLDNTKLSVRRSSPCSTILCCYQAKDLGRSGKDQVNFLHKCHSKSFIIIEEGEERADQK
jgi:hypothetical protein